MTNILKSGSGVIDHKVTKTLKKSKNYALCAFASPWFIPYPLRRTLADHKAHGKIDRTELVTPCVCAAHKAYAGGEETMTTINDPQEMTGTSGSHASGLKPNRLISEKSPYLLQHAYNPVDWFPWGDEAFEKARREDKLIFLSIGYSTCHWCHVMAHESFEDKDVAMAMNAAFVAIKVDREERPDIDHTYMTVCQMMTGSGGWPLNIVMTPDKKPFFAGTYFPRESRQGRIGMIDLSMHVKEIWTKRRDEAVRSADQVMQALREMVDDSPGQAPGQDVLAAAYRATRGPLRCTIRRIRPSA